jgi:predicted HTH transcriptional regulator
MTTARSSEYLTSLVRELCKLTHETEWVEFKVNNADPQEIGQYLSALANAAALNGKAFAYLVWGVEDQTQRMVGTNFSPAATKKGNEPLETWLLRLLTPKIHFRFHELTVDGMPVVLLEIGRAFRHPVRFQGEEFIRIGAAKKPLKEAPDRERALWRIFDQTPFEDLIAVERAGADEVLRLLDYPAYFDLLEQLLPADRDGILKALTDDGLIHPCEAGGSGIDKVVFQIELFQLPAPLFETPEGFTRAVLFAHKPLAAMNQADRVRACYMHACLRYVMRQPVTNTSIRVDGDVLDILTFCLRWAKSCECHVNHE